MLLGTYHTKTGLTGGHPWFATANSTYRKSRSTELYSWYGWNQHHVCNHVWPTPGPGHTHLQTSFSPSKHSSILRPYFLCPDGSIGYRQLKSACSSPDVEILMIVRKIITFHPTSVVGRPQAKGCICAHHLPVSDAPNKFRRVRPHLGRIWSALPRWA